jgi:hypothetical protein
MKKSSKTNSQKAPEINVLGASSEFYSNLQQAYTTDGVVDCVGLSRAHHAEFLTWHDPETIARYLRYRSPSKCQSLPQQGDSPWVPLRFRTVDGEPTAAATTRNEMAMAGETAMADEATTNVAKTMPSAALTLTETRHVPIFKEPTSARIEGTISAEYYTITRGEFTVDGKVDYERLADAHEKVYGRYHGPKKIEAFLQTQEYLLDKTQADKICKMPETGGLGVVCHTGHNSKDVVEVLSHDFASPVVAVPPPPLKSRGLFHRKHSEKKEKNKLGKNVSRAENKGPENHPAERR